MLKWATLLLMAAAAWPALAAKSMSVDQLEQVLDTLHGKSDGKVAQQLADVELEERVSPARLAHWVAEFPGDRARQALMKLADQAAFLDPLAADVLRIAPPDTDTQQQMLSLVADYVKATTTRFPNFYANRETTHFEDEPVQQMLLRSGQSPISAARTQIAGGPNSDKTAYVPLHVAGTYSAVVTYRDGNEVRDTELEKGAKAEPAPGGMTSNGEFGPILLVAIGDAFRSQVFWLHWEQGAGDPVAVFRYLVPQVHSTFMVMISIGGKVVQLHPGYHGEIAIDPATGAILRLSIVAELEPPYQTLLAETAVEFATVTIGDRSYICPVHAVALSKFPVSDMAPAPQGTAVTVQTQLNDVTFTKYHLFGSESHIVANESAKKNAAPPPVSAAPVAGTADSATVPVLTTPAPGAAASTPAAAPVAPNADSSPAPSDSGK